jgi:DNA-binding HxlR family transcriptional regulator
MYTKLLIVVGFFDDIMNHGCTVQRTVEYLGRKWALLILLELYKGGGSRRFSELKDCLNDITPKILSIRLKELEEEGLINKNVDSSSFPIKAEYSLTECGREAIDIIKDIKQWALRWRVDNEMCALQDCSDCQL